MSDRTGIEILQNEIEKSRDKLKSFNENIKKLTGYDNPGPRGRRPFGSERQDYEDGLSGRMMGMGRGRGRLFGMAKRGLVEESGPPVKRRVIGGAFSRLGPAPVQRRVREESPEEEELPTKLSVHSSVVSTSREAKNRQEVMQEQTNDKEGMQRNRRMFGLLLGTLNKFKTDSKTSDTKAEQRKRIDLKLEENAEKEKKKFKQDTMQLMEERHLEQSRISRLEQKMEVVQEHAEIEQEVKKLKNFLCTKAKPRIFWMPRQMNTAADNKLKDSVRIVDDMLKASKDRLEKEIKDVMERENKREERIKMRLREDGLFLDDDEDDNKEKADSKKDKDAASKVQSGQESLDKSQRLVRGDFSNNSLGEKTLGKKSKVKRRVVVEERSDREIDSDDDGDVDNNNSVKNGKAKKKVQKEDNEDQRSSSGKANDSDDDSGSDSDDNADRGKDSVTEKNEKSNIVDEDDNADDNSRVVLYRESSKDKTRSEKSDKKKGNEGEEDDDDCGRQHKSHGDKHKHSHRHSKHSRRVTEKVVVKDEQEDKRERKRSKSSERIIIEDAEGKSASSNEKPEPNLISKHEDLEIESENN